jgi:hypothetical protein
MRRRTLLVALAVLAVVGAAGVVVLPPQDTRATYENFCRVKEGMTGAAVEAIVGPPGDFTTELMGYDGLSGDPTRRPARTNLEWIWATDSGVAFVDFDRDGLVFQTGFVSGSRKEQGLFANLLWHARRQWHRWFP